MLGDWLDDFVYQSKYRLIDLGFKTIPFNGDDPNSLTGYNLDADKDVKFPQYRLDKGNKMVCTFAHHDDRVMVDLNDRDAMVIVFSMAEGRSREHSPIYCFWDYFETKIERRKRIIKEYAIKKISTW